MIFWLNIISQIIILFLIFFFNLFVCTKQVAKKFHKIFLAKYSQIMK